MIRRDDYLFTSRVRCNSERTQNLESLELLATECLSLHGGALLDRLPNLQWIVLVGSVAHNLLSRPGVWRKFREILHLPVTRQDIQLPLLDCGVSDVVALNERLRLIVVPPFSRGAFRAEHFRRIFASWMTRPPLRGNGARPSSLNGAPRAATEGRR
jgi:hypothetical protein